MSDLVSWSFGTLTDTSDMGRWTSQHLTSGSIHTVIESAQLVLDGIHERLQRIIVKSESRAGCRKQFGQRPCSSPCERLPVSFPGAAVVFPAPLPYLKRPDLRDTVINEIKGHGEEVLNRMPAERALLFIPVPIDCRSESRIQFKPHICALLAAMGWMRVKPMLER